MWRVHSTEEAGLLNPGGLPQEYPLCSEAGVPHGSGEGWPNFDFHAAHLCRLLIRQFPAVLV